MATEPTFSDCLFIPETPVDGTQDAVVAIDMGCAFTKVSFWNQEDNCSCTLRIDGESSIPTAIAYSVGSV